MEKCLRISKMLFKSELVFPTMFLPLPFWWKRISHPRPSQKNFLWTEEYRWNSVPCPSRSNRRRVGPPLLFPSATGLPTSQIPAAPFREKGTRRRAVADPQPTWNVVKKPIWWLWATETWAWSVTTAPLSRNHATVVRYGGNPTLQMRELRLQLVRRCQAGQWELKPMCLFPKPCAHPTTLSPSWTKFGSFIELLIAQNFIYFFLLYAWFPPWSKLHEG